MLARDLSKTVGELRKGMDFTELLDWEALYEIESGEREGKAPAGMMSDPSEVQSFFSKHARR